MRYIVAILILAGGSQVAWSAETDKKLKLERPALFADLVNCRDIVEAEERLACYDSKVAALDEAQQKEEIIVTDKAAVKEARRGLFGFNLPKIKIFGGGDENEVSEIEGTIKSVSRRNGNWLITLEDGARWQQISTGRLALPPKAGMPVRIKKAALGSFLVNIRGQRAIRMKRVN